MIQRMLIPMSTVVVALVVYGLTANPFRLWEFVLLGAVVAFASNLAVMVRSVARRHLRPRSERRITNP